MQTKQKIEIRYHRPTFSRKEVMEYLKLDKWPRVLKHNIGWDNTKLLISKNRFEPKRIKSLSYLCWTISPVFHYSREGLYLTDGGKQYSNSKLIKARGKFNTEGLINHIHLDHLISNRVGQYEIGIRAVKSWIPALKQLKELRSATIYLNGVKNFTLCVYSNAEEQDLRSLDNILENGTSLMRSSAKKFIEWAL